MQLINKTREHFPFSFECDWIAVIQVYCAPWKSNFLSQTKSLLEFSPGNQLERKQTSVCRVFPGSGDSFNGNLQDESFNISPSITLKVSLRSNPKQCFLFSLPLPVGNCFFPARELTGPKRLGKLHFKISKPFHTENFRAPQNTLPRFNLIVINYLYAGESFASDNKLETFCFAFGCAIFDEVFLLLFAFFGGFSAKVCAKGWKVFLSLPAPVKGKKKDVSG